MAIEAFKVNVKNLWAIVDVLKDLTQVHSLKPSKFLVFLFYVECMRIMRLIPEVRIGVDVVESEAGTCQCLKV